MARNWYILHTYTGYEGKIERTIRSMIELGDLSPDVVLDVKVPMEDVIEVKDSKRRVTSKKFLPGYIMLELDLLPPDYVIPTRNATAAELKQLIKDRIKPWEKYGAQFW